MEPTVEVFQDLNIRGPIENRPALREALINAAAGRWSIDLERSADVAKRAITNDDVILFRTESTSSYPAAGLTLWETMDGYYVPNIVPLEVGSLSHSQYNAILGDFIDEIAKETVRHHGFEISTTSDNKSIGDLVSVDAAQKLRQFSLAANKSTGASHPSDRKRWLKFIVAAYRSEQKLDVDLLTRWLIEVEDWSEEKAHELAIYFERSMELLEFYDAS